MARPIPEPEPAADEPICLDHERLDCYRVALEFQAIAKDLGAARLGSLRDQLDRASASIALNIAEGVGRERDADKAHFFAIARGSATECAAILDVLLARDLLSAQAPGRGRSLLVRIVRMLTRLIARQTISRDYGVRH